MKTLLPIITLTILGAFTFPNGISAEMKSSQPKTSSSSKSAGKSKTAKTTAKTKSTKSKSSSSAKSKKAEPKVSKASSSKTTKTAKSAKSATTKKESKDGEAKIVQAREAAKKLTTTQKSKLLSLLNEGSGDQLVEINGIAKTRSQSIIEARPFKSVEEIIEVKGIGASTYTKLLTHGKSLTSRKSSSKS